MKTILSILFTLVLLTVIAVGVTGIIAALRTGWRPSLPNPFRGLGTTGTTPRDWRRAWWLTPLGFLLLHLLFLVLSPASYWSWFNSGWFWQMNLAFLLIFALSYIFSKTAFPPALHWVGIAVFIFWAGNKMMENLPEEKKFWRAWGKESEARTFVYAGFNARGPESTGRRWNNIPLTADLDSLASYINMPADSMILRFALCESDGRQYSDTSRTQVLVGPQNSDGTYDHGILQINDVHKPLADSIGASITTIKGQAEIGKILLRRNGHRDWSASQSCWEDKPASQQYRATVFDAKLRKVDTLVASANGELTTAVDMRDRTLFPTWTRLDDISSDYVVLAWRGKLNRPFPYPRPVDDERKVLSFYPDSVQFRIAKESDSTLFERQVTVASGDLAILIEWVKPIRPTR